MEQFDQEQVRRIWQRVQAGNKNPCEEYRELAARAAEDGRRYLLLSRRYAGRVQYRLAQIAGQKHKDSHILMGMCRLYGEQMKYPPRSAPGQYPTRILLQQCYSNARQLLGEYERHSRDPQLGNMFRLLMEREEKNCIFLLSLLGK